MKNNDQSKEPLTCPQNFPEDLDTVDSTLFFHKTFAAARLFCSPVGYECVHAHLENVSLCEIGEAAKNNTYAAQERKEKLGYRTNVQSLS